MCDPYISLEERRESGNLITVYRVFHFVDRVDLNNEKMREKNHVIISLHSRMLIIVLGTEKVLGHSDLQGFR